MRFLDSPQCPLRINVRSVDPGILTHYFRSYSPLSEMTPKRSCLDDMTGQRHEIRKLRFENVSSTCAKSFSS